MSAVQQKAQSTPEALLHMPSLVWQVYQTANEQLPLFLEFWTQSSLARMISILNDADPRVRLVNVQGTLNVLQTAREAGVCRLVYTSSIHALTCTPLGL